MFGKKEDEVKITTLIGEGAKLGGDFSTVGSARIDGTVDGAVTVEGTLVVGATGVINGNVKADAVVIGGEVTGNIEAPRKTELTGTARVNGDIATGVIVIDENAVFHGKCDMNQIAEEKREQPVDNKALAASQKSAKAALDDALKEVKEVKETQD
ncbi:MAG: polymer-forming cytoskeletal protein [Lachnospiraceae bacterium]|nr:polymer-forming cytoskeletal protein [Lachnospiraceae bacterium]